MSVLKSHQSPGSFSELYEFTQGIAVDARLARQEVSVQLAWARALVPLQVISADEFARAEKSLQKALTQIEADQFEWRREDEDIHMNLERFVTNECGDVGKKIHLGRSRNDLIATTLRLFVRDSLQSIERQTRELIGALVVRAQKDIDILAPGLTHLQSGQPIRHAHALCAHAWAFSRDLTRLQNAQKSALLNMPLGSAALAGTPLAIDLKSIAQELGFSDTTFNSYDSVGDRDFILEALNTFSTFAVHLSRLSEDCIYWSSTAVGLTKLPKNWSTGSSIMPNKRNPDVPELIRAKSAHIMGAASEAHTLMKAVGTSYGSDLHELKSVFLRSFDELQSCLAVFPKFLAELSVDTLRARELLNQGHILATEIADALVAQGLSFREAYKKVALAVEEADAKKVQIHELKSLGLNATSPISFESAVERCSSTGGTAKHQVEAALKILAKF